MRNLTHAAALIVSGTALSAIWACSSSSSEPIDQTSADLSSGSPIVSAIGGKCLDDSGDVTKDGNKVQIYTCNGTSAQSWSYQGGAFVGPGGKCLDLRYDEQKAGNIVWLYTCNGTAAQQWTVDGTAIKSSGGFCLDVAGGVDANGTQVDIAACDSAARQAWTVGTPPPPPKADAGADGGTKDSGGPVASTGLPYVFTSAYSHAQDGSSPLFTPLATLSSLHLAKVIDNSATIAAQVFSQGIETYAPFSTMGPVYVVSDTLNADAPQLTFETFLYGSNPYSGTKVHVPAWAVNQQGTAAFTSGDSHLAVIDYLNGIEVDGWQCANNSTYAGAAHPGELACSYGRSYPIGSVGLSSQVGPHVGYPATHTGYATGALDGTPQEILDAENGTPIGHAIQLAVECLNNPSLYPAENSVGTDTKCTGDTPGNYPQYGQVMQLKPSYDVDGSAYSAACKAILKAGQTYGFYIGDTGDESIQLQMLNDNVYKHDPSHPVNAAETVFNQLLAAGDAKGTYSEGGGSWSNCFQRLQSSDFQILELSPP